MLIRFSVRLTPTTSSATKARPIWAPKLRTPGMVLSSRLASTVARYISGWDVPGGSASACLGPYGVELRHAPERFLHRNGDQLFHLGGGHADAFGLELHAWRRELGKDV